MHLTPQEMKKYEQALERQRKEIWEKSKKNRYKKTWYYSPPFYQRLGYRERNWWRLNRKWIELLASIIVGISLYYLAIIE